MLLDLLDQPQNILALISREVQRVFCLDAACQLLIVRRAFIAFRYFALAFTCVRIGQPAAGERN